MSATAEKAKKYRKVYFTPDNLSLIGQFELPSRIVNMACSHLKHTMKSTIEDIRIRFNPNEIEAITATFRKRLAGNENIYFHDVKEARREIKRINDDAPYSLTAGWTSAYPILMKHCSLDEINGLVYLSKFVKCSTQQLIDEVQSKFKLPEIDAITDAFKRFLPDGDDDYFHNIVQARNELKRINDDSRITLKQGWKKGYSILCKHCTTDEINTLVYLAKTASPVRSN